MHKSVQHGLRYKSMKHIKVLDSNGNNRIIRLYSTKRSKNVIAVKTAEDEILYAGSGSTVSGPSVMKVQTASGVHDICEYADDIPSTKLIAKYTVTQKVVLSKDMFPFGGIIVANGGKGTNAYGAGGKGSSTRMYFGALLADTVLQVTIGVNNGNAGSNGSNVKVNGYFNDCIPGRYYSAKCPDITYGIMSSNATAGGAGGKGSRATLDSTGETINAYGGGGGGGNRGSIYYAHECFEGNDAYGYGHDCSKNYTTQYGSFGHGGAAGNGASGSGVAGGSAGSSENVSVDVYAFTE